MDSSILLKICSGPSLDLSWVVTLCEFIDFEDCYIQLRKGPLCHYEMTLSVPANILCSKTYFDTNLSIMYFF